jgi:uncharacterized alpha-E superfamily protein
MLLRVADHLYWLGRYLERAENTANAVDAACHESLLHGADPLEAWEGLLALFGQKENFLERYGAPEASNILEFMLLDLENPASVLSSLRKARENGRSAYASLPPEVSESVNTLWLELKEMELQRLTLDGMGPCLDRMREGTLRIHGGFHHTLVHDEVSRLIGLGTFLERGDYIVRVLSGIPMPLHPAGHDDPAVFRLSSKVLRSVGAVEAYQKAYHDVLTPPRVVGLLLLQSETHCSLRTCLERIGDCLTPFTEGFGRQPKRLAEGLRGSLADPYLRDILPDALEDYLADYSGRLSEIANEIHNGFRIPLCA